MDLRVSAFTAAYQAPQYGGPKQAAARADTEASLRTTNPGQGDNSPSSISGGGAAKQGNVVAEREKEIREAQKNPAKEPVRSPGVVVEYDQSGNRITEVRDNKGVLIYQVPSKGQLALVEAAERASNRQFVATA